MRILPRTLKTFLRRFRFLTDLNIKLHWQFHLFKDWWGTKVWKRTTEVTTPLGFKLVSGFHPAYRMMRQGTFEREETAVIQRFLGEADVFVDVGANLGYYTCLALSRGKPVVAFEPQKQNLQCLFRNLIGERVRQARKSTPWR